MRQPPSAGVWWMQWKRRRPMQNVAVGSLGIPDAVLARARRTAGDISRSAADLGGDMSIDADEILIGRAALLGLRPAGRISAGGATRLLATSDGWCALTLSRDDDVQSVPALLETNDEPADPWMAVTTAAAGRDAAEFVSRARLLDLPAAILGEVRSAPARFAPGGLTAPRHMSELLVADLSSMWAGPLCGHLLAAAGATVVKVETISRPDGTRSGDSRFFDWMNASKLSYATDFRDGERASAARGRRRCDRRVPARGIGPPRPWRRTGAGSPRPSVVAPHRVRRARGTRNPRRIRRRRRGSRWACRRWPDLRRRRDRRSAHRPFGDTGGARIASPRRRRSHRGVAGGGGRRLCRVTDCRRSRKRARRRGFRRRRRSRRPHWGRTTIGCAS